ncbi:MAG: Heavy-chain fibroin (Fragment) [uncultured Paraburkholderia sp.]
MRTTYSTVKLKNWMQALGAVMLVSVLAACGGGDSGSNSGSTSPLNGSSLPPSPTQQPIAANAANTVAITVGAGSSSVINIPTVSVTICAPGSTTNCQTINNIQVDTGSFGLRVVNSVLNASLLGALPLTTGTSGSQIAECATFADGYTWGTVRSATVKTGGETTSTALPLQIIGDKDSSTVPTSGCGNGQPENTVKDLGANGILGIGTSPTDCGATCADPTTAATYSNYFTCPNGVSCKRTSVPIAQQVANPVSRFPVDNNGVIVQMPPIGDTGAASVNGTLVFGVGTQSNNALSVTQKFTTDTFGDMNNSVFNGNTVQAFLDSGSNGYFFADSSMALCGSNYSGFYCPTSAQTRTFTLSGVDTNKAAVSIGILSAFTLFSNGNNYAFNDLAGQLSGSSSFDLGLPFFYGRHVYYGIDQTSIGGTQTPFVGF